jgi:hypothetical protein
MRRTKTEADVRSEIERLAALDPDALRIEWQRMTATPPPRRMQKPLLLRALAYRIQAEAFGGLSKADARALAVAFGGAIEHGAARNGKPIRALRLKPGTRLVREWHGRVHEVTVLEVGFAWNGGSHRSLSEIARAITGTRWNGLVFFGVKQRPGPKRAETSP